MSRPYTIVPINTQADLDAALAAGAQVEFNATGAPYDAPLSGQPGSRGWIVPKANTPKNLAALVAASESVDRRRLRAVHFAKPSLLTRAKGLFSRKAVSA